MSTLVEIEEAAEQLDHTEKLHLMETLWDGLSRKGAGLESPAWHKEILEERRERVAAGKEGYSEWGDAKRDIRTLNSELRTALSKQQGSKFEVS